MARQLEAPLMLNAGWKFIFKLNRPINVRPEYKKKKDMKENYGKY